MKNKSMPRPRMLKNKRTLNLTLSEEVKRRARFLAFRRGLSVSQLVSELINREPLPVPAEK
jgi:predicted HicB family RNase H-like nuclease